MWGSLGHRASQPAAALATPRGSWSPAAGTPGLFLSSQPCLATLTVLCRAATDGRGKQTLQGLSWGCKDEQRSEVRPGDLQEADFSQALPAGGLHINPKDKPMEGPGEERTSSRSWNTERRQTARGLTTRGGLRVRGEEAREALSQMQQDQALGRSDLEMVTVGTEGATGRRIKRFREEWRRGDRDRWMNKKPPWPPDVDARLIASRTQRRMRKESAS